MLTLDPRTTAFVLIDGQKGILSLPLQPHSAETVIANAVRIATVCKEAGGIFARVRVSFSQGYEDKPRGLTDTPMVLPERLPEDWDEIPAPLAAVEAEVSVVKRQWSAFHGTELDLQLRRRGIETIVIGGVATSFGVESTARDGWQNNYSVVVAEDACSSMVPEIHAVSIAKTLPRVSRVRSTEEIVAALRGARHSS